MWKPPSLKLVLKKKRRGRKKKKGRKQDLKQMPSARFLSCFREEEPCHLPVYQPFLLGSSRFAGNEMSCGTSLALCLRLGAGQDGSCSPEHPGSEPATAGAGGFVHRSSVLRGTEPVTFQAFMPRSRAALAQGLGQTLRSLGMCRSEPCMEESFLITLPGDAEQICWVFAGFHQEITSEMGEPRCCQGLAEALLLSSPPVLSSRAGEPSPCVRGLTRSAIRHKTSWL